MKYVTPGEFESKRAKRREKRRERVLKTVAVLPSLATLGNLLCGLGAIYMCLLSAQAGGLDLHRATTGGERIDSLFPTFIAIGAYLLVAAMFFDGIDGRLARLTRKTSEFGAQLDSLADVVSFGVAPAVLVLCIAQPVTAMGLRDLDSWDRLYWRAEWVMAAIYTSCAALRLARFNVENEEDESAHMGFRGLPSPGAAAALIGMVILHQDLIRDVAPLWASNLLTKMMPPMAMLIGLLMVSRFRYAHLVNTLLRGKRPFREVVIIAVLVLCGLVLQFQLTVAVGAVAYALSGPIGGLVRKIRAAKGETVPLLEEEDDMLVDEADGGSGGQSDDGEAPGRSVG